jgi:hypothetical protein
MLLILFSSSEPERDERDVDLEVDALVVFPAVLPLVEVEALSLALAEDAPLLPADPVVPDALPEDDDRPDVVLPEFLEPDEPVDADEPEELDVLPDPVDDDGLLPVF